MWASVIFLLRRTVVRVAFTARPNVPQTPTALASDESSERAKSCEGCSFATEANAFDAEANADNWLESSPDELGPKAASIVMLMKLVKCSDACLTAAISEEDTGDASDNCNASTNSAKTMAMIGMRGRKMSTLDATSRGVSRRHQETEIYSRQ